MLSPRNGTVSVLPRCWDSSWGPMVVEAEEIFSKIIY